MKIGILVTSVSNFGEQGYYNSQEIGLGKALTFFCEEVVIYKLVPLSKEKNTSMISEKLKLNLVPAKNAGINGKIDVKNLDATLDAIIHFSDTQFSVPKVYSWCRKNKIIYAPYIGVVESHSTNKIFEFITNLLFNRNLAIYKKCECFTKTPKVQQVLAKRKIYNTSVTPVGLDLESLYKEFENESEKELKKELGFEEADAIILFIGRFIEEKRPIDMIKIFYELRKYKDDYKLIMVGNGALEEKVKSEIQKYDLDDSVKIISKIPNDQIWKLYHAANYFINLNRQEIFGMAILEAMYYKCSVIAWSAPGPNYIIEDGISGKIVNSKEEIVACINSESHYGNNSNARIVNMFTWDSTAKKMNTILREIQERKK